MQFASKCIRGSFSRCTPLCLNYTRIPLICVCGTHANEKWCHLFTCLTMNPRFLINVDCSIFIYVLLKQHTPANNVEIQCVTEMKYANPIATVLKLVEFLKCSITEDNILKCTRTAKLDRSNPRPRSIVAQLTSQKLRVVVLCSFIHKV